MKNHTTHATHTDITFTERETDVLHLLTEYLTTDEMSARLQVKYQTIETHLKNIKRKLRIPHRMKREQMIKYALDNGYGKRQEVSA